MTMISDPLSKVRVGNLRLGNAMPSGVTVVSASVELSEFDHDRAVLTLSSLTTTLDFSVLAGKPVSFTWGVGMTEQFFGYVGGLTPSVDQSSTVVTQDLTCLGATTPMKEGSPAFWVGATVAEVVAEKANAYRLGFNDETGLPAYRWRSLAQCSESDWETVVALTRRIGARLVCEAGVLRLLNADAILQRTAPVDSVLRYSGDVHGVTKATLYAFNPVNYANLLPSSNDSVVGYLAGGQAHVIEPVATALRPSTNFDCSMPVRNEAEARYAQRNGRNWPQEASATVKGNPAYKPGTTIAVRTASSGMANPAEFDGVWYIRGVRHDIDAGGHYSALNLHRPQRVARNPTPYPQWFQAKGKPTLIPGSDGHWQSSWRGR